jgi:hypothetical protein
MTAAAAMLKMTTPSAVGTEVICYIIKKRIIISDNKREMEEDNTYRIRIRSSLHAILLTPTPFHSRTAKESGATGELFAQGIGAWCTTRLRGR